MIFQRLDPIKRQRRVEISHFALHRPQHRFRIGPRPRHHRHRGVVIAKLRPENRGLRFLAKAVVFSVPADPNDFPERILGATEIETLSYRILTGKQFLRESFVHDRDSVFGLVFLFSEIPSSQRDSHCPKVIRANRAGDPKWKLAGGSGRLALEIDGRGIVVQAQRNIINQGCCFDPRKSADAFERLFLQGASSCFIVTLQTDIEGKRHGVVRVEAGPHSLRLLQAAQDKSRADKQDERERDLGDDQRVPQTGAAKAGHRRFIFQSRHQRRLRRLEGRNEAE